MTFAEVVDQATAMLQRRGRVTYRLLQRQFDLDDASRHEYDPTHFQPVLFCADSFEAMYQTLREYLVSWY